ncbi:MAG: NAD(P)-dependent oxidoreductase [Anaerolineae bacterium]|nr:MAG: NAD(P)-dependent oxidoreductase [Anaerolineae bacterium]
MKILVTGVFGWTAISIVEALKQRGHSIVGLDLPSADPLPQIESLLDAIYLGSVADFEVVSRAICGCDAVVHLAVAVGEGDYATAQIPFETNVKGTYHIFEEARRLNHIHKIVLMSSAPVHRIQAGKIINANTDFLTSADDDHLYDLTKCLQEHIAHDFCNTFGLNAVVLRAGHIVDGRRGIDPLNRPLADLNYLRGGWVCRYDLANAVVKALDYPKAAYDAFHVIGGSLGRTHFDIERTERELGYSCAIDFAEFGG